MKNQIFCEVFVNCQFEDMSVWFHVDWSFNFQTPVKNQEESKHRFPYLEIWFQTYLLLILYVKLAEHDTGNT